MSNSFLIEVKAKTVRLFLDEGEDVTPTVNAAIEAAQYGWVVAFPEGVFTVRRQSRAINIYGVSGVPGVFPALVHKSGVSLLGAPGSSGIPGTKLLWIEEDNMHGHEAMLYIPRGAADCTVRNLIFDGGQPEAGVEWDHHGIMTADVDRCRVVNCTFQNIRGKAVFTFGNEPLSAPVREFSLIECHFDKIGGQIFGGVHNLGLYILNNTSTRNLNRDAGGGAEAFIFHGLSDGVIADNIVGPWGSSLSFDRSENGYHRLCVWNNDFGPNAMQMSQEEIVENSQFLNNTWHFTAQYPCGNGAAGLSGTFYDCGFDDNRIIFQKPTGGPKWKNYLSINGKGNQFCRTTILRMDVENVVAIVTADAGQSNLIVGMGSLHEREIQWDFRYGQPMLENFTARGLALRGCKDVEISNIRLHAETLTSQAVLLDGCMDVHLTLFTVHTATGDAAFSLTGQSTRVSIDNTSIYFKGTGRFGARANDGADNKLMQSTLYQSPLPTSQLPVPTTGLRITSVDNIVKPKEPVNE